MENIEFLVTEKITGLTPNTTLDVSEIKIPTFLELSDPQFFEAKEIHALLNADIFFKIMKDNVYKMIGLRVQDTQEEALLISCNAKNIMKEAGMVMRKWISNDSALMNQWKAEGFDTYPVDTSVTFEDVNMQQCDEFYL
ncbi:unnamed protein product [Larinioides sclopetarius]|uniref:Uncharacterized protein n=1 Tax=Larinioides sclopetarius TaxID=280406 RepID=A0AAV2BT58_9ARAC